LILSIFPSIDTGTCARSVRKFNKTAAALKNTRILCISKDLPFAQSRFCGAEGIENVQMLSDYRDGNFGKSYGVEFTDGDFITLLSRAIVVIDTHGIIRYTEQVPNTSDEPDYGAVLQTLMDD
jgi:thiol peroxidase